MKYEAGNIVLLNDNRTVYIMSVNEESKTYSVFDTEDNSGKLFSVSESDIMMYVT